MGKSFVDLNLITFAVMEVIYLFGGALLGIIIGRSSLYAKRDKHVLHSIIYKLNIIMADSAQIKQQVADLNAKVTALQASVDAEQESINALLATNAQVVTDLNAEIARLNAIIAAGGTVTPEDLQLISDGIQTAMDQLATTQADLEGTV